MNLSKKIIISFLLVSIVPIIAFGFLIVDRVFEIIKQEAFDANSFMVRQVGWQLDTYLESVEKLLGSLSLKEEFRDFDSQEVYSLLESSRRSYTIYYGHETLFEADPFDSFTVLDRKGRVEITSPFEKKYIGEDYSGKAFFQEVLKTKKVYFSSQVLFSPLTGNLIIQTAFPVFDDKGEISYVIKSDIDTESIDKLINSVEVGGEGFLSIINQKGEIVSHPDREKVLGEQNIEDSNPGLLSSIKKNDPSDGAILFPLEDSEKLIAYFFSQKTSWIVLLEQPLSETLAAPLSIRTQFIMILLFTTFSVCLIAFSLSSGITRPLNMLTRRVLDVTEKGDLRTEIDVKTKDEIGKLASSFNQMMRRLRLKTEELEESRAVLEIKVEERTRELADLNDHLERKVEKRTKDLQQKVDELNKWHKLTVGRELRMVELKKKIKKFEGK